jgi:long-subunit acyl-CoA synthetase (AMP-forming)
VFDEDGWVHTGDIGTWNENGTLTLVDRKENIVKLQGGDFVAYLLLLTLDSRHAHTTRT